MLKDRFEVSKRRACQVLRQPRATQRYLPKVRDDEQPLTRRIIELASIFGRYGYRQVTAVLRLDGWWVNHKRVERIWRREGLKVPKKQPKRGRLWLNDGSCIRLRAERTKIAASGCSDWWMNTQASAWRYTCPGN